MGRLQLTLEETEKERAAELSEMTARQARLSAHCHGLEREREERDGKARELVYDVVYTFV